IHKFLNGQASSSDLDKLDDIAANIMGRTICAFGDAAAMPVRSFIKYFRNEFAAYIPQSGMQLVGNTYAKT
ncbi:MAG TPA: NADH-ubiquinone oxidoreductase-F iron-sulfur binding region domain-containing protein, partial [Gammaproteobacteria bacterium]|nr:NADH-ubiquinone oxidoreductase-F iron-sulfur binding region domain-containing protein [Gammaproteobacteria bacterium]